MKQIKILKLLSFLIFFSLITISCEKTHLTDESVQTPADEYIDNTSIDTKDYCGNPLTFPLKYYDNENANFGVVTIANDASNLIFNYDLDDGNEYYILKTAIFVINDGNTPPLNIADPWNTDGTAHFMTWEFPFRTLNLSTKEHQDIISFVDLENEGIILDDCLDVVAGAKISSGQWIFAKSSLKAWGYYVDYCIEECVTFSGCETAYAFGGDQDDCFINLNTQGNKWGWSNGGITEGTYSWPIYAGAGQCDISKGTLVGTLDIVYSYSSGVAQITYNIDAGITLEETHLHIGESENTRLPKNKKKKFITAPGKYDYSGGSYFEIDNLSGPIWVTAHAVVCGED